jgi:predicted phage terminase large subunit-like protein
MATSLMRITATLSNIWSELRRGSRRVGIAAPPGSAKSRYVSVLYVPWYLSQHPDHQIICASHTVSLAEKHARQARNLVMEHSASLGIELADDSQAAGHWSIKQGGSVFSVGSGGTAVGRRANLILIDDPVAGQEEAHSEGAREKLFQWYSSDLLTRLKPSGRIVIISTIWHEDDLFSRLERSGRFEIVKLPAVAEEGEVCPLGRRPGEYLWDSDPDYPYGDFLRAQREVQSPANWSALFQQHPSPATGSYFLDTYFRPYTTLPARESMHVFGASDFAVSVGHGDWTVHVVVGQTSDGQLWLLDCWRRQAATDESVEAFCDLVNQWKPLGWAQETGQINASLGPFMRVRMRARNAYVPTETFPTRGDKSIRATSIRGRLALNPLRVNEQAPYWAACRAEALSFPVGRTADFCDALGLVGQILDRMSSPHVPTPKPAPKRLVIGDPAATTVTLEDLWEAEERRVGRFRSSGRIR